jgi:hypothetical protein
MIELDPAMVSILCLEDGRKAFNAALLQSGLLLELVEVRAVQFNNCSDQHTSEGIPESVDRRAIPVDVEGTPFDIEGRLRHSLR